MLGNLLAYVLGPADTNNIKINRNLLKMRQKHIISDMGIRANPGLQIAHRHCSNGSIAQHRHAVTETEVGIYAVRNSF